MTHNESDVIADVDAYARERGMSRRTLLKRWLSDLGYPSAAELRYLENCQIEEIRKAGPRGVRYEEDL